MNQIRGQFDVQSGSSIDDASEDYYALLGLAPFESNPATISARARDLMRDARKYQVGPRAAEAQVKIERLAMASACLLDSGQKVAYDNVLRERFGLPPVSIRSDYVPEAASAENPRNEKPVRRLLSPRVALALIVILVAAAIAISQQMPESSSSIEGFAPSGNHGSLPAPALLPVAHPDANSKDRAATGDLERTAERMAVSQPVATGPPVLENRHPGESGPRKAGEPPFAQPTPVRDPAESTNSPASVASAVATNAPPMNGSGEHNVSSIPPRRPTPTGAAPGVDLKNLWPDLAQAPSGAAEIQISSTELLRQLREFRLKRSPAMRMSLNPQMLGAHRVVELVQYGRATFPDDRRFQRQLDQEVIALRRLYAPFRDVLPEPEH